MSRDTLEQRIRNARNRVNRKGQSKPESTLNITFSVERVCALVRRFDLHECRHGLPTIVAGIGDCLGVYTTRGVFEKTIEERIEGQTSVSLSFLIPAVITLCTRFGIDPQMDGEDTLGDAIFHAVMRDCHGSAATR
jgi:hypothetical protein